MVQSTFKEHCIKVKIHFLVCKRRKQKFLTSKKQMQKHTFFVDFLFLDDDCTLAFFLGTTS